MKNLPSAFISKFHSFTKEKKRHVVKKRKKPDQKASQQLRHLLTQKQFQISQKGVVEKKNQDDQENLNQINVRYNTNVYT